MHLCMCKWKQSNQRLENSHATRKNNIGTCGNFDWQHGISPTTIMGFEKNMLAPKLEISLPKMAVIMFSQHDADGVRMAMEWEVSLPKTRLQQLQLMAALCLLPFWEEAPWSLPWFGFQVGAHGHWPGAAFSWECHLCNGVQFLGNWPPMVSHSHYKLGWLDFWSWWAKSKTCIPVWNTFGTTTLGFHPPPIWSSQWWLVGLACGTPWVCHTGSSLVGFFILAPQHLAHGGLIEAGGCEWLGLVFLEIKIVGKCRSCLIEPYVVKNRTHWNAKKGYGKLHATFTWQRTWFLYSCLSLCIAIWQKKAANQ